MMKMVRRSVLSVLIVAACFVAGCSDSPGGKKDAVPVEGKGNMVVTPAPAAYPPPTVAVSSQLDNSELGPQGLWFAKPPGWHSKGSPVYPQFITYDFGAARARHRIELLPQTGQPTRGPKAVDIEVSEDGKTWRRVGGAADACRPNATDGWFGIDLPSEITSRYLRLRILSNCGAPDLLTLQGFRVL